VDIKNFYARDVEYVIIKHFVDFYRHLLLVSSKKINIPFFFFPKTLKKAGADNKS